jgi:hypothetical protein
MRFTFYAVVLPLFVQGLELAFRSPDNPVPFGFGISFLIAIWFACGAACTVLYWLVRVVRYAWGNGSTAQPITRSDETSVPDTGRIFGQLN